MLVYEIDVLWAPTMSIDNTSLNKACPKDHFPLPRIDQIVDSTSGCDLLYFLDAYSSFHQIPMSREDEEHTAFIIVDGLFCYVSMPYGLKNALPTFMRAMHKTFGDLITDLVEVYVADIVVKIKSHIFAGQSYRSLWQVAFNMHDVEPGKVCVQGLCWKAARLPGFAPENRGQPREDQGNPGDVAASWRELLQRDLGPRIRTLRKGHGIKKLLGPRAQNPPRALIGASSGVPDLHGSRIFIQITSSELQG
jgi:hypothetical protein